MEQIIHFLQAEMEQPTMFSWFHIISLLLIVGATFCVSFFLRDASEKTYKRILLISWIILVVTQVIKQLIKSFHYGDPSYWEYDLYDFPFHICSMILYMLPILVFVNKDKYPRFIDAINGYLCIISVVAGLAVCIYINVIMTKIIFINIQDMLHHGLQVILGVYIFVWNRKTITFKTYYRAFIVFGVCAVVAILINLAFYPQKIDMFYLNPLVSNELPIGETIQTEAGFIVYLLFYISVIGTVCFLTYFAEIGIYKLILKKKTDR